MIVCQPPVVVVRRALAVPGYSGSETVDCSLVFSGVKIRQAQIVVPARIGDIELTSTIP
jgi:hypothetical protein